jgi:chromosome segregation ATPase
MSQTEQGGDCPLGTGKANRPRRVSTVSLTEYEALQRQNQTLMDWVGELERTLAETQVAVTPGLGDEPPADRIMQLEMALSQAQRFVQQQQAELETLQEALTLQQQRVAEMERNCVASLQQCRMQEEKTALLEESCRRLQDRLDREQRQNLQLKQALDKCLADQVSHHPAQDTGMDTDNLLLREDSIQSEEPVARRRVDLPYFLVSTASGTGVA